MDPSKFDSKRDFPVARVNRLKRWRLQLQHIQWRIHSIAGLENVWGDLLSPLGVTSQIEVPSALLLEEHNMNSISDEDFVYPDSDEIRTVSTPAFAPDEEGCIWNDGLWIKNGLIYVPDKNNLRFRIFVVAHAALCHRAVHVTMTLMRRRFVWRNLEKDVQTYVRNVMHVL